MPCSRTGRRRRWEQTGADRIIGKASPAPNAQRHAQQQLEGGGGKHCGSAGGRHARSAPISDLRTWDWELALQNCAERDGSGCQKVEMEGPIHWAVRWQQCQFWDGREGSYKADESAETNSSREFKTERTMRGSTQERGHSVSLLKLIRSGQVLLVPCYGKTWDPVAK